MAITNFGELKTAIADWLDRSNLTDNIPTFVKFAEGRIHYGAGQAQMAVEPLRCRSMENTASLTASSGTRTTALPTGYLQARRLTLEENPRTLIEFAPPEKLWRNDVDGVSGRPRRTAVEGDNLVWSPLPDKDYALSLQYFKAFDALSADGDTNWLLTNAPDVYLYAALTEASIFTRNLNAANDYAVRYGASVSALNRAEARARASGSSWFVQAQGVTP